MFPVAVNSEGHEVVHEIVAVGDRMEDLVNEGLFGFGRDILEAKMIIGGFIRVGGEETNYFTYFLIHN